MNKEDAFKKCFGNNIKNNCPKGTWASYTSRYKQGKLKESTIVELLLKYGFRKIQDEDWTDEEKEKNFVSVIVKVEEKNIKYFSVESENIDEAIEKIKQKYNLDISDFQYKEISNLPMSTIVNRINSLL